MSGRLLNLIKASRPISWVNTAYPFAAGYVLVARQVDWRLVVGSLFFLIPYNLLMYGVNDVFDYESDIKNPRKGGVEGALVERPQHRFLLLTATLLPLPFVAALLLGGSLASNTWLAYLLFMVVAYSLPKLRFKEIPLLDSFTSATHFVSPLIYGVLLAGWQVRFWPYIVAFFLWAMASHAFGAVQDIIPDRQAHIHSIGTFLGAARTVRLALGLYVAAAGLLAWQGGYAWVVAVVALGYVWSIAPYAQLSDRRSAMAHAGWRRFLALNWLTGGVVTIVLIVANR